MKMKFMLILMSVALVLAACSSGQNFKAETDYKVSASAFGNDQFKFTNQNNDKVTLDNLKGKPWLAMFIFTSCTTVCPPMTANMVSIQKQLKDKKIEEYNIVGFSVDPMIDTPKKLHDYMANYDVPDAKKWQLLTGYSQEQIEKFAVSSFKTLVKKVDGDDQVTHGTSFILVNQEGVAVKSYSGISDVPIEEIAIDMETIISDGQ